MASSTTANAPKGDWEQYLNNAVSDSSRSRYEQVVRDFQRHMNEQRKEESDLEALAAYLEQIHNREGGYAATTMRSIICILATYFVHVYGILLSKAKPIIYSMLRGWKKQHKVVKSKVLSVEETDRFLYYAPNDSVYLPMKVGAIMSYYGLLRKSELIAIEFEDIQFDGMNCVVKTTRLKQSDGRDEDSFIVNGEFCLQIVVVL